MKQTGRVWNYVSDLEKWEGSFKYQVYAKAEPCNKGHDQGRSRHTEQ
jgi:hypothetical protein